LEHRVGAAPARLLPDRGLDVVGVHVEHIGAVGPYLLDAFGDPVDTDHPAVAAVGGDPAGHRSDRAEAEHHQRAAVGHRGVLDALPGGGQHVGQVDITVIGAVVRHRDVGVLRLWNPQVLGLPAGDLAVELRVAEQCGAGALIAVLGGLALTLQTLSTHPTGAAGDVERNDHAVAGLQRTDLRPHLLDHAHGLVAQDVARTHEGTE